MITRDTVSPARRARIVAGLADGLRDEEIAADLGVKRATLTNYISVICRQFDTPSRDSLIRTAFWDGWLPVTEDVPLPPLPDHLRPVLRLMAAGATAAEIGRRYGYSEVTARRHRNWICAHYGARTRAQAVALAYRCRHLRLHTHPSS